MIETKDKITEHRNIVLRFINKEQALCVKDDNGIIVGVLLFSRGHNMICCLGVSPKHRRYGIASCLLSKALECLEEIDDIMGNFTNVHPGLDIEYSYWRVSTATVLVNKEHGGNYKKAGIYCNQYGSECVYESYN